MPRSRSAAATADPDTAVHTAVLEGHDEPECARQLDDRFGYGEHPSRIDDRDADPLLRENLGGVECEPHE